MRVGGSMGQEQAGHDLICRCSYDPKADICLEGPGTATPQVNLIVCGKGSIIHMNPGCDLAAAPWPL
jgi:hypothetical protein